MRTLLLISPFLLAFLGVFDQVKGQVQDCSALCNASFNTVFALRCPAAVSTNENCSAEIQKLIEDFKKEDQKRSDFLIREYCSASLGWRIKKGQNCYHGGPPPCCVAKDLPWERVSPQTTMSAYRAEQKKIYDQRQQQLDRLAKSCAQEQQDLANQAKQKQLDQQKIQSQKQADLLKQQELQRQETAKKQAIAAENQRKAYLAELERKEAERKRKQDLIDQKVQNNFTTLELSTNLQQVANERTAANFGSGISVLKDQLIENPLSSSNNGSRESAAAEISRNSQSLDDIDFEKEYLKAVAEPTGKKISEEVFKKVGETIFENYTDPNFKGTIKKYLNFEVGYKQIEDYKEWQTELSKGGDGSEFIKEKLTDKFIEKTIPNELIKEHVTLNGKWIKSVSDKSLNILDNTFAKIDDFFKELPDDEEEITFNKPTQSVRNGRSYFRPGNDDPDISSYDATKIPNSSSANPPINNSNKRSSVSSSLLTFSGTGESLPTKGLKTTKSYSGVNGSSGTNGYSTITSKENPSGNNYSNTSNSSYPLYNYRYTPNSKNQPPPPTKRQQRNWSRVQNNQIVPIDSVPPPELRKGYWELNFCAYYLNFRR